MRGLPSDPDARRFVVMILAAFMPALIVAPFLSDFVKAVLHESPRVIAWAFIIGGVVMLAVERPAAAPGGACAPIGRRSGGPSRSACARRSP